MNNEAPADRPPIDRSAGGLSRQLASGSAWMVAMRWSIKVIGLLSTLILARLLTPADFGLVAKAMVLVLLIESLSDSGQRLAIIRMEAPTREHYDSAWTMQICLGWSAGLLVFLCAPLAGPYFDSPHAVEIAQLLALRPIITSFENIGTLDFRRHLNFGAEFRYGVYTKLASFCVTMALALYLRNFWALVIGIIANQAIMIFVSYLMHPFRPRLSLKRVREIWSFSIWTLATSVVFQLQERLDHVLVAGAANTTTMGHYSVGAELGRLAATEVILPATRAVYPVYAKAASDIPTLRTLYLRVLAPITFVLAATSVGLALVADDLVNVVLGAQWAEAAPFLVFAALAAGVTAINQSVVPVLLAVNEPRKIAVQATIRLCAMLPLLLLGMHLGGVLGIVQATLIADILLLPTYFRHLKRALSLSVWDLLSPCWRSLVAAAAMAAALTWLPIGASLTVPILHLAIQVAYGAVVFFAVSFLTWRLAGSPDGAEAAILGAVMRRKSII